MSRTRTIYLGLLAATALSTILAPAELTVRPAAAQQDGRHRQRRYRRRGHRTEGTGGRRMGDRGDHRPADQLHQDGRDRRPGPLRHPGSADRQLSGLGAWLWAGGFTEAARQARPDPQSHRGGGAERRRGRALLSRDLLVFDAADSAGVGIRRHRRHSEEHQPHHLDPADEERRLHRLSSARATSRRARSRRSSASSRRTPTPGCGACGRASSASR